jgi:hypothetical protein
VATMLVFAAESNHLAPVVVALAVGLVVGVFGHIIKSRTLILTGILVIGLTSAYFSFVLQPSGK